MKRVLIALTLALAMAGAAARGAEKTLIEFGPGFGPAKTTADAKAACVQNENGGALRVAIGHKGSWPGVTLAAPGGQWDLSPFAQLTMTVKNTGTEKVTVTCRVDNRGANGTDHCINGTVGLEPGQSDTLKVNLKRTHDDKMDGKLFGMRGYPVAPDGPGTIDPAQITQLLVFVNHPKVDHVFEISSVRAVGDYIAPTASTRDATPFFPFVDTFGQYKHKEWPGKTHSVEEMKMRREAEAKELAAAPDPEGWDKWGGWAKGPQLKATGYFRTEKVEGKWWLVDPEGRLFFSHGVDCVGEANYTPVEERESWLEDYPGKKAEFTRFAPRSFASKGYYKGRQVQCFAFSSANLLRKYGADWSAVYGTRVQWRLRKWGLNTIANWSDPEIYMLHKTPYTDTIGSRKARTIEGGEGYWAKFPDVFDPSFEKVVREEAWSKAGKSMDDPWCIGYFSDNEMAWGTADSHALAALKSPADQPAKLVLIADLKAKYGEIAKLNAAWGTQYESWEALTQSRTEPDRKKAKEDLEAFGTKVAERYFKVNRGTIRAVAPHQLYLGCRFAWVNDRAAAAAAKYCDVVSYNIYKRGVEKFDCKAGADVPLIVGEFHFGALDRGMFHTGLVPTASQAERAQAYKDYVLGALRHPQFVGTGWFKFQDEPLTGRVHDEENYQIGFVDAADTPYDELVAASREVARKMYQVRMGKE